MRVGIEETPVIGAKEQEVDRHDQPEPDHDFRVGDRLGVSDRRAEIAAVDSSETDQQRGTPPAWLLASGHWLGRHRLLSRSGNRV